MNGKKLATRYEIKVRKVILNFFGILSSLNDQPYDFMQFENTFSVIDETGLRDLPNSSSPYSGQREG